ncbi:hypothetical protein [Kordia sp.]|uniref:hypothetical protein n=1 Tax=Kordia sp. TaxID=1965332 RepID=UPI003D6A43F0
MKTKKLKSLKLNKASISNLQQVNGGAENANDAANNAAQDPIYFLSIGKACSKKNSCKRVCGDSTATITPIE